MEIKSKSFLLNSFFYKPIICQFRVNSQILERQSTIFYNLVKINLLIKIKKSKDIHQFKSLKFISIIKNNNSQEEVNQNKKNLTKIRGNKKNILKHMIILNTEFKIFLIYILFQIIFSAHATEEECDKKIQQIFIQQNIPYKCEQDLIIINGNQTSLKFDLVLQDVKSKTNIKMHNFTQLTFQNVLFQRFDRIPQNENISDQPFLNIKENQNVIIEDIKIYGEQEDNIMIINLNQNDYVQINNMKVAFENGFNSNHKKQQIIASFLQNNFTKIFNYTFLYNQPNFGLQEYVNFISMYIANNASIYYVDASLNYNKYVQIQYFPKLTILQVNGSNEYIDTTFSQINMNLNSLSSLLSYFRQNLFILYNTSVLIDSLNIQNQNFLTSIINLQQSDSLVISNINAIDWIFKDRRQLSIGDEIFYIVQTNFVKNMTIHNINIQNCTLYSQYLILFEKDLKQQKNIRIIETFRVENSYWTNTMIYIFINAEITINMFISKSNFEGEGSIVFLSANSITLSLQLETASILNILNGFVQIGGTLSNWLLFQNINITIQENTDINLGIGGIFQTNQANNLNITNCTVKSLNNKISQSQNGGIFYIDFCDYLYMSKINASGFKINGQGGFAFIDCRNVLIEDSIFSNFYSEGSGGTLMIKYINLNMTNVYISNSYSGLFGGGIYSQSNTPLSNSYNFINMTIANSEALIGGGMTLNAQKEGQKQINFQGNKAYFYNNDTFFPLSQIKFLDFGEFNKDLIYQLQYIPKPFKLTQDSDQYIFINDTDINQIYYMTLELIMGDEIISYQNLVQKQNVNQEFNKQQIEQQYSKNKYQDKKQYSLKQNQNQYPHLSKNIFNMIYQKKAFEYGYNNVLEYAYSNKSDIKKNFIKHTQFNYTEQFYFLFQISEYFIDITTLDFNILGNSYYFELQKQKDCNHGKIKIERNGIEFCKYCNYFQFINGTNQPTCYVCLPSQFYYCSGNMAKLKERFYWIDVNGQEKQQIQLSQQAIKQYHNQNLQTQNENKEIKSLIIIECSFRPENCKGGEQLGDNQCFESNVGTQCLECDKYQTRQHNKKQGIIYTRDNTFKCHKCRSGTYNKTMSILLFFGFILAIFVFDLILFLSFRNYRKEKQIEERIGAGIHFKFLLFFLQIMNVCSFYLSPDLFDFLYNFSVYAWNPISNSYTNFFECFLLQNFQKNFLGIPISYVFLIIQTSCPIIFIFVYILIRSILIQLTQYCFKRNSQQNQNQQYSDHDFKQPTNYQIVQEYISNKDFAKQLILYSLYNFSQQIVQILMAGTTCVTFKNIGDFSYIDLTLTCDDPKRIQIVNYYIILMLTIFVSLFPGYLITSLLFHNKNLKNEAILFKFGFLYNEYEQRYYYWEFVRFLVKLLINMSIFLNIPNNNIIGFPVLAILAIYSILLLYLQPHKIKSHSFKEFGLVLSGILMILCYVFNYICLSNNYFINKGIYLESILLFGNSQAILVLAILIVLFLINLILLKVFKKCKRCIKRRKTQSEQINNETDNYFLEEEQ